jgi:hypothetical protein
VTPDFHAERQRLITDRQIREIGREITARMDALRASRTPTERAAIEAQIRPLAQERRNLAYGLEAAVPGPLTSVHDR